MDVVYLFIIGIAAFLGMNVIYTMGMVFTRSNEQRVKTVAMLIAIFWEFIIIGLLIVAYHL